MIRVLLTGVSGQVGGALYPLLRTAGDVLAPDRARFDLARPETLVEALDTFVPDLIVNPAAYTAVDRAEDEPDLAYRVNSEAVAAMAGWAAARRVPLVHFSTDYVFDGHGDTPWNEDSITRPLSVYGSSKLAGETAIRTAGGPHLIVRTSWVYNATGANFFKTIARLAGERKTLRIVADQVGAPTSARTIAHAVFQIMGSDVSRAASELASTHQIVNVACAETTSWYGFATAIVSGLKARGINLAADEILPIEAKEYPTKAIRPSNSRLDLSRLKNQFGVMPPTWSDALSVELDEFVGTL